MRCDKWDRFETKGKQHGAYFLHQPQDVFTLLQKQYTYSDIIVQRDVCIEQ